MNHSHIRLVVAALGLCWGAAALAQAGGPVMKLNQVTEQGLVDALAVDEPAADEGVRTRSIRPVQRNAPATSGGGAKPATGRSNLLITFLTNSSDLTRESKEALGTVAKAMQSEKLSGLSFSIEGHADPRGSAELNQKLSAARAESVVAYLVSSHGIAADRLAPVGKGSSEPLNADRPDSPENRRVTIVTKRP